MNVIPAVRFLRPSTAASRWQHLRPGEANVWSNRGGLKKMNYNTWFEVYDLGGKCTFWMTKIRSEICNSWKLHSPDLEDFYLFFFKKLTARKKQQRHAFWSHNNWGHGTQSGAEQHTYQAKLPTHVHCLYIAMKHHNWRPSGLYWKDNT